MPERRSNYYITNFTERQRAVVLLLLLAILSPLVLSHVRRWETKPFWDANGYAEGITGYGRDGTATSAYVVPGYTPIDYPPVFILGGHWLARILTPEVGYPLYLLTHIFCLVGLPFLLVRFYLPGMGFLEAYLLLAIAPLYLGEEVLFATNIASICYFLIFVTAIPGLRRNRWIWFYAAIILASSLKIIFLLFLLLPLLLGTAEILPSAITVAATCCIYIGQMIMVPDLYREFRKMISINIIYSTGNYGYALYGMVANLLKRFHSMDRIIPGAAQVIFAIAIVAVLLRLRTRVRPRDPRWVALVILAFFLITPRLADYDTVTALLPAYFLLLPTWRSPLTLALLALSFAGLFVGHGAVGLLFLLISGFIVGVKALTADFSGLQAPALEQSCRSEAF